MVPIIATTICILTVTACCSVVEVDIFLVRKSFSATPPTEHLIGAWSLVVDIDGIGEHARRERLNDGVVRFSFCCRACQLEEKSGLRKH